MQSTMKTDLFAGIDTSFSDLLPIREEILEAMTPVSKLGGAVLDDIVPNGKLSEVMRRLPQR